MEANSINNLGQACGHSFDGNFSLYEPSTYSRTERIAKYSKAEAIIWDADNKVRSFQIPTCLGGSTSHTIANTGDALVECLPPSAMGFIGNHTRSFYLSSPGSALLTQFSNPGSTEASQISSVNSSKIVVGKNYRDEPNQGASSGVICNNQNYQFPDIIPKVVRQEEPLYRTIINELSSAYAHIVNGLSCEENMSKAVQFISISIDKSEEDWELVNINDHNQILGRYGGLSSGRILNFINACGENISLHSDIRKYFIIEPNGDVRIVDFEKENSYEEQLEREIVKAGGDLKGYDEASGDSKYIRAHQAASKCQGQMHEIEGYTLLFVLNENGDILGVNAHTRLHPTVNQLDFVPLLFSTQTNTTKKLEQFKGPLLPAVASEINNQGAIADI